MKSQTIQQTVVLGTIVALTLPLAHLFSQTAAKHAATGQTSGVYLPSEIQWKEGPPSLPPGAKAAMLEGDMSKEGPFTVRLRLPNGYHIPAHTHPAIEHVTVISGTLKLATEDKLDQAAARPLPVGSFAIMPAGMKHAAWVEGETILQAHGVGPWGITYLNPADDPRNAKKN